MVIEQLAEFKRVSSIAGDMPAGTPIDAGLADYMMGVGGIAAQSEEEYEKRTPFIALVSQWLNQTRVDLLDELFKAFT